MIEFGFAIALRVKYPIINHPKLTQIGIDVHAGHYPDPFDNPFLVPTPLPAHDFNGKGMPFVSTVSSNKMYPFSDRINSGCTRSLSPWGLSFFSHQAIDTIMTELFAVVRNVCLRVIDLTHQQKLRVVPLICSWRHYLSFLLLCVSPILNLSSG